MTADIFPEDSVLRRHATTERMRLLGLPPTDSVLRRHYEQLQQMTGAAGSAPAVEARPSVAPKAAAAAPSAAPRASAPVREPEPAAAGGFFGWLKRLLAG